MTPRRPSSTDTQQQLEKLYHCMSTGALDQVFVPAVILAAVAARVLPAHSSSVFCYMCK